MAHSLIRLKSKIDNQPHLMELREFEQVLAYLDASVNGRDVKAASPKIEDESDVHNSRYTIYEDDQAALFTIEGPMTYKPVTMFGMDCGGFSYEQFKQDFRAVADKGVKTVGLMLDSGGGEAYQLFDTANYVRSIADQNGMKILSYVDGMAASACYGLAAISDEILMNSSSEVGSIGVVVRLINDSEALKKEGYERTFVTAGADKVPFDADGKFKESFIADIQSKIDVMYGEFTEHVAKYRNISVEQVKATEARTFLPEQALQLGLADQSMTLEEFYSYFANKAEQRTEAKMLPSKLFKMKTKEETTEMTQLADLQAQLQAKDAELSALTQKVEDFASMETLFAEAQTALSTKDAELVAALDQVQTMQTQAKEAKELARKDKLAAVMAADKVEGVAASLAALDDTAFEVVLSSFSAQAKVVAESDLFTEMGAQGVEAEATVTPTTKQSSLDDVIKARLQNR